MPPCVNFELSHDRSDIKESQDALRLELMFTHSMILCASGLILT